MTIDVRSYIDLVSVSLGGEALLANDEFFASKDNLLKPEPPVFREGVYTDRGKWMDGWETRRRREPGHDWCVLRLGLAGTVRAVVVDTTHFRGNAPEAVSLQATALTGDDTAALERDQGWVELVPESAVAPDSENLFAVSDTGRYTHVRLNIFPDGGVARLRVLGEVKPDWDRLIAIDEELDLVAVEHGGLRLAASDEFFGPADKLLQPGPTRDMGDGWETRRRRGPGHDWAVLRLGRRGRIDRVEVDTSHFKGNHPESCSLETCDLTGAGPDAVTAAARPEAPDPDWASLAWRELLARTPLEPDRRHVFDRLVDRECATHVRFCIYPDGGVGRLRLFGRVADDPR